MIITQKSSGACVACLYSSFFVTKNKERKKNGKIKKKQTKQHKSGFFVNKFPANDKKIQHFPVIKQSSNDKKREILIFLYLNSCPKTNKKNIF